MRRDLRPRDGRLPDLHRHRLHPATVFPLVAEPSSMKRRYEAVDDVTITTDGATKRGPPIASLAHCPAVLQPTGPVTPTTPRIAA